MKSDKPNKCAKEDGSKKRIETRIDVVGTIGEKSHNKIRSTNHKFLREDTPLHGYNHLGDVLNSSKSYGYALIQTIGKNNQ